MAVVWLTLICKDSSFASEKMLKEARAQWVHVFQTWRLSNLQASGVQLNSVPIDVQVFPQGVHKPSTVSWMGDTCGYHEQLSINNDKRIQEINRSLLSDILQPLDISIVTMFYTSYQNIWDHCLPRGSTTKNLHRPRRCSFSSRIYQW